MGTKGRPTVWTLEYGFTKGEDELAPPDTGGVLRFVRGRGLLVTLGDLARSMPEGTRPPAETVPCA